MRQLKNAKNTERLIDNAVTRRVSHGCSKHSGESANRLASIVSMNGFPHRRIKSISLSSLLGKSYSITIGKLARQSQALSVRGILNLCWLASQKKWRQSSCRSRSTSFNRYDVPALEASFDRFDVPALEARSISALFRGIRRLWSIILNLYQRLKRQSSYKSRRIALCRKGIFMGMAVLYYSATPTSIVTFRSG